MSAAGGRPAPAEDQAAPDPAAVRRLYDEAMAGATVRAPQPLQRYLAVLLAAT